ncbi:hypothetical protein BH11ARM2_BH11ARM2_06390 [soil metagenome]
MKTLQRSALVLLAVAPSLFLTGCSNVGDTNPTSPDQMSQIRKQQEAERSNFKPPTSERPPSGGK